MKQLRLIDVGGNALFFEYTIDFSAILGAQLPFRGGDVLLQFLLITHAYKSDRDRRMSQCPGDGELCQIAQ